MSRMRHGEAYDYRTHEDLTRAEKEARRSRCEECKAQDARNPFMFRFTMKVMHALEKRHEELYHRIIWTLKGNANHPDYPKVFAQLKAVSAIYDAYGARLRYFEKGEC